MAEAGEALARHRLLITGRVHGVGFRWWTSRRARTLGLRGTVRNLPDGAVEVEVEGPESAVAALRSFLAAGPPAAAVADVQELEPGAGVLPDGFDIVL